MNEIILETTSFIVEVPAKPFVDREDGGHLRIMLKIARNSHSIKQLSTLCFQRLLANHSSYQ